MSYYPQTVRGEPAGTGGFEAGDDHGVVPVVVQADEAQVGQAAETGSAQAAASVHQPGVRSRHTSSGTGP
ncbi:hypothetical protein HUT19_01840 [Streptomyces sp. NA02950]|uniref:hypothetical protein n=1 Tax=Streptomyces sp. NA02950 TaxID=2742137 RepID=UPI001591F844|nr:hypothetical protein [Streptomyces sp. NA02950]QKV90654.1 hypothetical protein HUT19_01840 [Streptomyces sp. NA02950]